MNYLYKVTYDFIENKRVSGSGSYVFESDKELNTQDKEVINNVKNKIIETYNYEKVTVKEITLYSEEEGENNEV